MALFHFEANTGTRSGGQSARAKLDYIAREGSQHTHRDPRLHVESGHMPAFAAADATLYWQAADDHERANGRLFKHLEIALQRELSFERNLQLARDFVEKITSGVDGGNLPYTFTIHAGGARDTSPAEISRSNIHFDVMISERINDGLDRGPEIWFSRAATGKRKTEADGGAKKTKALKPEAWLKDARKLWAEMANEAFAEAGLDCRIDHRTLEEQREEALAKGDLALAAALHREPGQHLGPRAVGYESRTGLKSNRRKHIEHRQRERRNLARDVAVTERIFERLESQIRADQDELRRERGLRVKEAITRRIAAERAARKPSASPSPLVSPIAAPVGNDRAPKAKAQPLRIQKLGKLPRSLIPKGIAQWARDAIKTIEGLAKALERFRQEIEQSYWMHQQIQRAERARVAAQARANIARPAAPKVAPAPAPAKAEESQTQVAKPPSPAAAGASVPQEIDKLRRLVDLAIEGKKGIHKSDALARAASAADSESVDRLLEAEAVVLPKALDAAAKSGDEAIFKKLVGADGTATDAGSLRDLASKCGPEARAKLNALAAQAKTQGSIEGLGIDPPPQPGAQVGTSTKLVTPS